MSYSMKTFRARFAQLTHPTASKRPARQRVLISALVCVAALTASLGTAIGTARPALAGSCTSKSGQSVTDPTTGWHWTVKWTCGNDAHTLLYGDANATSPIGYMDSNPSWFVCYRRGAQHSGGNNVWYYTLGDRTNGTIGSRQPWGYIPAVHVWTSTDPWPGMPACPIATTPPARTSVLDKPVYFVHGYDDTGNGFSANINDPNNGHPSWYNAIQAYKYGAAPTFSGTSVLARAWTWCYYSADYNCDLKNPHDRNYDILDLGRDLAQEIWDHFSKYGIPVDIVAHSMGGLIVRAAILGTEVHWSGFPPYLDVEDVSTISTPHRGGAQWETPCNTVQCNDMEVGSGFLGWLYNLYGGYRLGENPQSAMGTDWTLIGFDDDYVVPAWSAAAVNDGNNPYGSMPVGHKVIYGGGQIAKLYAHGLEPTLTSGSFSYTYCDYNAACDMANRGTWYSVGSGINHDPIQLARNGSAYQTW